MSKWLDIPGLKYFWGRMKEIFDTKVDKVDGYGLSENDFTDAYKQKIDDSLDIHLATESSPGIVQIGNGLSIDENGILTPKVSEAADNILTVKTGDGEQGLYVPARPALHKLIFGAGETYEYDGSEEVTVPVYTGETNNI